MDSLNEAFAKAGVEIAHHFGGGAYAKVTRIPPGVELTQHAHPHDHLSFLIEGTVVLQDGPRECVKTGFQVIKIPAGTVHSVRAVTPAIWACLWATDCNDPAAVDQAILGG